MAMQETPRMGALLNEIGRLESNNQPNVIYGNNTFDDYSDHPRQNVPIVSGPNQDLKTSINLFEAPPFANKYPDKVNNGIVGNVGDTTIRYISVGIAAIGTLSNQKKSNAKPPSPTNIGAPRIIELNNKIKLNHKMKLFL